jgi:regulator of sigma E protease
MAKSFGVRIEQLCLGFGPKVLRRKKRSTEYSVGLIPLGGYVKMAGDNLEEYKGSPDEYFSLKPVKRFWIIFTGPLLNYILGILFFWMIFFIGYPSFTTKVGELMDGFGAQKAGMRRGDIITAIDGKKVSLWEDMQKIIREKKESDIVTVSLTRDGLPKTLKVNIRQKQLDDAIGQKHQVGLLGISPTEDIVMIKYGFFRSAFEGAKKTLELTVMTYKGLWAMLTGQLSVRNSISGLPGIFKLTSLAARLGLIAILHLMAILSISLAIFNLLPIPVLDGGHIMFLVIEKIRGRTLSVKTENVVTKIGIAFIISLAIFVNFNDLFKHYGDKLVKFFR